MKTAPEELKDYLADDTLPLRESQKFILEKATEYEPLTPWGLNKLPYALTPAVAICMEEYAAQRVAAERERIKKAIDDAFDPGQANTIKEIIDSL